MGFRIGTNRLMTTKGRPSRDEAATRPPGVNGSDLLEVSTARALETGTADNPERNIPVRKEGRVTWLTWAEYEEHYRREGR